MSDTVLGRVAALKAMPTGPSPYNRRFLKSRLAYRTASSPRGRFLARSDIIQIGPNEQ
jgi:hypothetical protein